MATEGACLAARPVATTGGPDRSGAWAKETETELLYSIARTVRKELSTAQQRVEESFFEGRLKSAIAQSREAPP